MKIPIVFLGTGQAIPTAKRNHTSILLTYKSENILVDCGEGTQRQFRKAKINPCKLTRILITHWHGDHVLGLPGLLQTLALNNYNRTLYIYVPKGTRHYMDLIFRLFVFDGKIRYEIHEVESSKFEETDDFYLEARSMQHRTPCVAYSFVEKEKLRVNKEKLGKLGIKGKIVSELAKGKDIEFQNKKIKARELTYSQPGRKITFILDTKINENCYKIAENSDLLICESTYTTKESEQAEEYKHLTAAQAAEIAKKAKAKRLVLTHLSQRYENKEKLILDEAKKVFKNTEIAEDLARIEV
jgi:ribonuclease Z